MSDLEKIVGEVEELKTRAEAAEARVKDLESEKSKLLKGVGSMTVGNSSNSVESRALRAFGVSNAKDLVKVNTGAPRFANVSPELKHEVLELKRAVDTARHIAQIFRGDAQDHIAADAAQDRLGRVKHMLDTHYGKEELAPRLKAFGSTVVGQGDEWVPTLLSATYIDEYELDHMIGDKFKEVAMPSNPYDLPVKTGVTTARLVAEGAQMTSANWGTTKLTLSAKKFSEYTVLPEELSEDAAPDVLAAARDEIVRAQMRAIEKAIISGDDDGTHIDSDTQAGAADLAEKAWKGLRRQALANSANGGTLDFGAATVSITLLRQLRAKMKKFGVNPAELMWIVGPSVYQQLVALDQVLTQDKYGPQATIFKGALGSLFGIGIYVSEFMREDLNNTGVYDGVTMTKGGILLVNKTRWYVGTRRPIVTKVQQDLPSYDRWLMASYQRKDFVGHAQSAAEVSVAYGINIAL
jgi:HK97 family phage major capsid protein